MVWPEPKFRMTRSHGYDSADVDALIDRLEAADHRGERIDPDQIRNVRFTTHWSGYRMDDVDAWLDQVAAALAGPTGPAGGQVPGPAVGSPVDPPGSPAMTPATGGMPFDASAPPVAQTMPSAPSPSPTPYPVPIPDSGPSAASIGSVESAGPPRWLVLSGLALILVIIVVALYLIF